MTFSTDMSGWGNGLGDNWGGGNPWNNWWW
jgi:hypothetical protein